MGVASVTEDRNWSLRLLACGVVSAPLFVGVVLAEAVTRQGFDLVRMPLSLLSLGDTGWVQRANFIACGLLFALASIGLARRRVPGGGVWGTRLVGYSRSVWSIENVWGNLKSQELANLCADSIDQVADMAEDRLDRIGTDADLCFAFLHHSGLRL